MGDTVALIGMGLLGSALAENLLAAGFAVRGYDVAPDRQREHAERGGIAARSPAHAARGAWVVKTCHAAGAPCPRLRCTGSSCWRASREVSASGTTPRSWRCSAPSSSRHAEQIGPRLPPPIMYTEKVFAEDTGRS